MTTTATPFVRRANQDVSALRNRNHRQLRVTDICGACSNGLEPAMRLSQWTAVGLQGEYPAHGRGGKKRITHGFTGLE